MRPSPMRGPFLVTLLLVIAPGCGSPAPDSRSATASARQPGQSPESPKLPAASSGDVARASGATPAPDAAQERQRPAPSLFEALGFGKAMPGLPAGLVIGGDCPPASGQVDGEIADQAQARIPLKVGLTLVNLWKPTEAEEYECLTQVTAVQRDAIDMTIRCNRPGSERTHLRRICRSDLTSARMLHTAVGAVTVIGENGEELPETIVGATEFSLSRRAFAELKSSGQMSHHYVQIGSSDRLEWEARTTLQRDGADTAVIAINGHPVTLPVIRASGETAITHFGKVERGRVTAVVVDDERFPMLVDYTHTVEGSPTPRFRLHFPKVTYPGTDAEGELARRGRLIVHGIYFDFNSDRIRKESDPILTELGQALARHPDWTLTINGHTDNVGGDAYNLALSKRRAEAVGRALVERHGISAERLRSDGLGASSPIEPNDTPEGRARNRRVELVRVADAAVTPPPPAAEPVARIDQGPVIGGHCDAPDAADVDIAAQAGARVPLHVGLTLATAWHRTTEGDDVECLTQVREISASGVTVSAGCAMRDGTVTGSRRVCREDLTRASIYYSGAGDDPDTLKGATMFSLSRAAFRELKARRQTTHRNVSLDDGALISDLRGMLTLEGPGTFAAIVNDRLEQLPVLRAQGRLKGMAMGKPVETRVRLDVLDDDRFPLVLDYSMLDVGATGFVVRYTRISFPAGRLIEERLASEKRVDVYGIYFDFGNARLRAESEPVLREIADALRRHPDWTLSVDGHTDGIGGERANQQLSERRSAAVRDALVLRHGIESGRLAARGFGASRPKDTNQTREGRALNRRVELVRQ